MKTTTVSLLFPLLVFVPILSFAQTGAVIAVNDTFTITAGQGFSANVAQNDTFPAGSFIHVFLSDSSNCFALTPEGEFIFIGSEDCCGDYLLKYEYQGCDFLICSALIKVTVKCEKPDCYFVDMERFRPLEGFTSPNEKGCIKACAHSQGIYYANYVASSDYTYTWTVEGGTYVQGVNPAEILVTWGPAGAGKVTLSVSYTQNGKSERSFYQTCVDILDRPVANFQASGTSVCLEAPVSFNNLSTGGSHFSWDFGDGQYSNMFAPTHQYTQPGNYTVCLYVTRESFSEGGSPLCDCTDTICTQIQVDSLKGPNIFCVSTLCATDSTLYWTDAGNCQVLNWKVLDDTGASVPFNGNGNDTISVHWGTSPFGTVSLTADDCGTPICTQPVTISVPIIPPVADINGPEEVCRNETATYIAPKWPGVHYDWQVTGGIIVYNPGSNLISVYWNSPTLDTGVITLHYYSEFSGGLPGHDSVDCAGTASLIVLIRPAFRFLDQFDRVVCQNASSVFTVTSAPSSDYTWTIQPAVVFTGGANSISVNWNAAPGTYTVTAITNDPAAYCNDSISTVIEVLEQPAPDTIEGPVEICPGNTYTYIAQSSETGVEFIWAVSGGAPATWSGNPVTVTWDATGPYQLSLRQKSLLKPFCESDPIVLKVTPKLLNDSLTVLRDTVCVNSVVPYSSGNTPQHPDATFQWTITPSGLGSVIGGQGTGDINVQWNNDSGTAVLTLMVLLCGDTLLIRDSILITAPKIPEIKQLKTVCSGDTTQLSVQPGFLSYDWNTGATGTGIEISAPGIYTVMTLDSNGCASKDSYQADFYKAPTASISPKSTQKICIDTAKTTSITLYAIDGPGYAFQWFCNGLPSGNASSLVHTATGIPGTFNYFVVVTDTGGNSCTAVSNTVIIIQDTICGDSSCKTVPYSLSFAPMPQAPPDCNTIDFTVMASASVDNLYWDFDDPDGNLNTGIYPDGQHKYNNLGCALVHLFGRVKALAPDTGYCNVDTSAVVCIPLAADFTFSDSCLQVNFTDLSLFLSGHNIIGWQWDFGDGGSDTQPNPEHTYAMPGTFPVTLTVTNADSCQASIVLNVEVGGAPKPDINIMPTEVCVGVPVIFDAAGAGLESWLWDFGDNSANNGIQNPSHTYLAAGIYEVTVQVADANGCSNADTLNITVDSLPPADTIAYSPGLKVCKGKQVSLTAPSGMDYTWEWSTGETTQEIIVDTAGTYTVTVTNAQGCTMVTGPVTVVLLPLPDALISGNPVICDYGCVTLSTPPGLNYLYQWLDANSNPINQYMESSIVVCSYNLLSPYYVVVKDTLSGCVANAGPFEVRIETSPQISLNVAPDACEGKIDTIRVSPAQINDVVFSWNNGAKGSSIQVAQSGLYSVVATDTTTGCTATDQTFIFPLPDLCVVPVGCYEACNPDTICGPEGLASYQWNLNGLAIPGANDRCFVATQSGNYSLTGTNWPGCMQTSDELMLEMIDCACFGLNVTAQRGATDSCCWSLSYINPFSTLYGLSIQCSDADFYVDPGQLDAAIQVSATGANFVFLENATPNTPLPQGALNDFLGFCPDNVQNSPQRFVFHWLDNQSDTICSDTIVLESRMFRSESIVLCPGDTIPLGGNSYSEPDTVTVVAPGANGACDTLVTYILTMFAGGPSTVFIDCPDDITLDLQDTADSGKVDYDLPTAGSDCACPGISLELNSVGFDPGSFFPIGETEVHYTATDDCGNTAGCFFRVIVTGGDVCDEQTIDCIKYELMAIEKDLAGNQTYRIRVTNNCSNKLIYAAFQMPSGITAIAPANNSVYVAPNGHEYDVRNPNFSPFYSIRFKSATDSISNGESEIFEYVMPPQVCQGCVLAMVRLYPKIFHQAHLCCVMTNTATGTSLLTPEVYQTEKLESGLTDIEEAVDFGLPDRIVLFPNPSTGLLYADLSAWQGESLQLQLFNSQGQRVQSLRLLAGGAPQQVLSAEGLPGGLYWLELMRENGEKQVQRFEIIKGN